MNDKPTYFTAPDGEIYHAPMAGMNGMACGGCGKPLDAHDHVVACADCGMVFCQECVENGTFTAHECDDDEEDI